MKVLKYLSTHIMLFHSIKQYVIILSTSFFQILIPWPLPFRLKLRMKVKNEHPNIQRCKDTFAHTTDIWAILLNKIRFNNYNTY